MSLADNFLTFIGGLAGASIIYFIVMGTFAYLRHKRDERQELRSIRTERMIRDVWLDWLRRGAK